MPLYEYQCDAGHRFEKIVKFSDPPLEACPTCGAPVQKLFSSPAIQFKGSGWYITDYARKASADSSGSTSPAKGPAEKTSDKSSDSASTSTDAPAPASTATTKNKE
jgi:putative FmdB family regulatory protein